ncbi:MAG: glycosyltransferase family 4 protein [Chloroflexota bacterium]|nr:glycosyltransferase family 4 protein [Chloroflexota bacterium]
MKPKRPRILYIEKPTDVGGSVISLYELVRGLDTSLYEPIVLFYGPNPYREQFRTLGVKVITLSEQPQPATPPPSSQRDIAASLGRYSNRLVTGYRAAKQVYLLARCEWPLAKRVARLIEDETIDLVHDNNSLHQDAVIAARMTRVPQVCHVRTLYQFSCVERYLARSVNTFIYISSAVERSCRNMGIPADGGQVVHNPIDVEVFGQADGVSELRAEFGLADQDRLISNVGRLDWWKGHDDFLRAMAEVTRSLPNTKALIVGTADSMPRNQAYYQGLGQLVTELGLSNRVIFTGFRTDIPRIMAASDVVVHSASKPEPFGRVIVEAMAAGRPIVATAAGGVLDIVEDQVTGLLVPPRNAAVMAQAIQRLLNNREEAGLIGQRAQQDARERFSVERHVTAIQDIYQKVLV